MNARKIRILLAALCGLGITLLLLDLSGTLRSWLGWLAKIQFLPALLALHVGVVLGLLVLTLLFGRIYCSVICPLGVMQDGFAWLGRKAKKNRYGYSPEKRWLRYGMLALFVVALVAGVHAAVVLLAPYSTYGRIVQNLAAPLWGWANNAAAAVAEQSGSYAFSRTEVWVRNWTVFGLSAATLLLLAVLAWRNGRTWCNTVCPVGTVLSFFARFSLLRPVIDRSKCNGCGKCARNCKAACIDSKNHAIDYGRCVTCFDCLEQCRQGAIYYEPRTITRAIERADRIAAQRAAEAAAAADPQPEKGLSRRSFLSLTALLAAGAAKAEGEIKLDGGLAAVADKEIPDRQTPIVPPGARSARRFAQHCTGCQLCVAACPSQVLCPSGDLERFMQPELSYRKGYCRPECTACSEVCPTGAIGRLTAADKSALQVGHAVWVEQNCVALTDGVACGNCARHCPSGAITMVASDPGAETSPRIPVVNTERCIGCGACEYLCPARPFSAIYVEGHEQHRTI